MTPRQQRLVEAGATIKAAPAEDPDYVHTVFTSVYLPVRDPGPVEGTGAAASTTSASRPGRSGRSRTPGT
jgi:hypothetical protein